MNAQRRLKQARKTRRQIASLFRDLNDGQETLQHILEDPPRCLNSVRIFDLLRRAPHLGEAGANKCLRTARVWPTIRIGNLTQEQREQILEHLPPRAKKSA